MCSRSARGTRIGKANIPCPERLGIGKFNADCETSVITPAAAHSNMFDAYAALAMYDKAAESLAEEYRHQGLPQQADAIAESYRRGGFKAMLRKKIAIEKIEDSEAYYPYGVAESYMLLGDKDDALVWLHKAYETRSGILFLKVDTYWKMIRSDPRYNDLLRRMGLPH